MTQPMTKKNATVRGRKKKAVRDGEEGGTFQKATLTHYGEPWKELPNKIQYLAYSNEICPTTGRPHCQAWAYSLQPMRFSAWKKVFPGAHIEKMIRSFIENDEYCSKTADLIEFGVRPMGNGQKRSLQELGMEVVRAAQAAESLSELVIQEDNVGTYVQYHNGFDKVYKHAVTAKMRKVDKDFAPEVIYIFGAPGSGKTRYVYDHDPEVFRIPADDNYKWKDGYYGQDAVLYDNVSLKNISPDRFLTEIDRYYCQVSVKGGFVGWRPKRIYITSVYPLDVLADGVGFSHPAELTRRVTSTIKM